MLLSATEDPNIRLEPSDLSDSDSNVLVRERTRGSKLEAAYQKRSGKVRIQCPCQQVALPQLSLSKRNIGCSYSTPMPTDTSHTNELVTESTLPLQNYRTQPLKALLPAKLLHTQMDQPTSYVLYQIPDLQ